MADETIGGALKRCREEAGLTLRDVSRASGMSVNQISQVETGRRPDPAFSTVAKIAVGLRLSLDAVARATGYSESGPTLKAGVSASDRKVLAALRELEDASTEVAEASRRIGAAVEALSTGDAPRKRISNADVKVMPSRRR